MANARQLLRPENCPWEETLVLKVVGLNPGTICWMDIFSHIFVGKIVMFV